MSGPIGKKCLAGLTCREFCIVCGAVFKKLIGYGGVVRPSWCKIQDITIPNKISPKVIFTDPHFRIFGISLLPRRIGKFYAINIRKKLNPLYGYYHLGYYCTYFKMIQLFKKHNFLVQGEGGPSEKKIAYKLFREEFTFICKKN